MKFTDIKWTKFKLYISPRYSRQAYRKSFGVLGYSVIIPYMRPFAPHDDRFSVLAYNPSRSPKCQRLTVVDTLEKAMEYAENYFRGLYEGEGNTMIGSTDAKDAGK